MPRKASAALLLFRLKGEPEVSLVHPGGPFWAKKDAGAWSLPKGEFDDDEEHLEAARREFAEETGFSIDGEFRRLEPLKQRGGKRERLSLDDVILLTEQRGDEQPFRHRQQ